MSSTRSFYYTGNYETWTVPAGVTSIGVSLRGGGGGIRASGSFSAGEPGTLTGTLAVTPGDVLYVFVGGGGGGGGYPFASYGGAGAYPGGGAGGDSSGTGKAGGGGGGFSAIGHYVSGAFVYQASCAGGGGSAYQAKGGDGQYTSGATGAGTNPGTGGSQSANGAGAGGGGNAYNGGGGGYGGTGASQNAANQNGGGGGGGGYYGGGGGGRSASASTAGAGGGGSIGPLALTSTVISNATGYTATDGIVTFTYNQPPNAPTLNTPANNVNFDVALTTAFTWAFSDPDPGDTQSSADFQWRVGTGAWTVSTAVATTASSWTTGANAWVGGVNQVIEWQVRTTDNGGLVGPWSASSYFTPRTAPAAPTITPAPTINSNTPSLRFTFPTAGVTYEARVVNDVAGAAGATVYAYVAANGMYVSATGYTAVMPSYAYVNATSYHLQVRYQQYAGVWSPWADSGAIAANINAPLAPTLTLAASNATASITLTITNPGSDPYTPSYNDIYRTNLDDGSAEIRIARNVALNATYTDWTPASLTNYRYRVVAVTAAGAFSSSA